MNDEGVVDAAAEVVAVAIVAAATGEAQLPHLVAQVVIGAEEQAVPVADGVVQAQGVVVEMVALDVGENVVNPALVRWRGCWVDE